MDLRVLEIVLIMAFLTDFKLTVLAKLARNLVGLCGRASKGAEKLVLSTSSNGPDMDIISKGPDKNPLSKGLGQKQSLSTAPGIGLSSERPPPLAVQGTGWRGRAVKEDVLSKAAAWSNRMFEKELNCGWEMRVRGVVILALTDAPEIALKDVSDSWDLDFSQQPPI